MPKHTRNEFEQKEPQFLLTTPLTRMWSGTGKVKRRVLRQVADRADVLRRYGPSLEAAANGTHQEWWANRMADQYFGKGRYSRRLRSYGRRMYRRRPHYRRYGGGGLYTGTGGFWDDLKRSYNNVSGRLGAGIKAAANATGFGQVADALTKAESAGRALGFGDYETNKNDIVDGGGDSVIPQFSTSSTNTVCISHKEYISDIFGPATAGTFQNTYYSLNPGIERTFPWLSQVAANYEEYTLKQCIFTFRSTVTDFVATNGQVGTIIMATQYNPSDTPFQSKQDAMEYDMAMSGKCSANMLHGVECDPEQLSGSTGKYVRAGPVRADDDLKQYDWGNLNVAISNIPPQFTNQALGELWVSYTIELRKPKFFVSRGLNILRDSFVGQTPTTGTGALLGLGAPGGGGLSPSVYGYAQQNRIQGFLEQDYNYIPQSGSVITQLTTGIPAPTGASSCITYTFPATFSGTVRLRLLCTAHDNDAAGVYIRAHSNAGAIVPINDMWEDNVWRSNLSTESYGRETNASSEVHIQVTSPTSAGATAGTSCDNVIELLFIGITTPLSAALYSWDMDISVYNTQFNYPSSGNQIIMNPVTDIQEQWP